MFDLLPELLMGLSCLSFMFALFVAQAMRTGSESDAPIDRPNLPRSPVSERPTEGRSLHVLRAVPDNVAPPGGAADLGRPQEHHLARIEEDRGLYRAHCSCLRAVSHPLESHAACEAWVLVHQSIEERLAAFGGAR